MSLKDKVPYRDLWLDAVTISHYCPALGNPWKLTWSQWKAVISRIDDLKDDILSLNKKSAAPIDHMQAAAGILEEQEKIKIKERRFKAYYGEK